MRLSRVRFLSFCTSRYSDKFSTMDGDYSILRSLQFKNHSLSDLPLDESKEPGTRKVKDAVYSLVDPTPVLEPKLVAYSSSALKLLDVDTKSDEKKLSEELERFFSGNEILDGSRTYSHCYCGHQFGLFSGQLGDGAAIYLGNVVNAKEEGWELNLKGAGRTPFSRNADGRKVLRSSIREFLCSEAMFHLGIPTTRAASVVTSSTQAVRDKFYDGRAKVEQCALVLRLAPTFLRFGSFEVFKYHDQQTGRAGPNMGNIDMLIKMVDFTIKNYYPHIEEAAGEPEEKYLRFFTELCTKTAELVAKWQCIGFCHGVLNTDNMSIVSLTIDYGPFKFMESYNPGLVSNGSDEHGRYAFDQQQNIVRWNLGKFAEALKRVLPLEKSRDAIERAYIGRYIEAYAAGMRGKLGLAQSRADDEELFDSLFDVMKENLSDFTNTFRALMLFSKSDAESRAKTEEALLACSPSYDDAKEIFRPKYTTDHLHTFRLLGQQNPLIYDMVGTFSEAIQQEMKKAEHFDHFKTLDEGAWKGGIRERWSAWLDRYAERVEDGPERQELMKKSNPRYVLRNYLAENAIAAAEEGDFAEVRHLLRRLQDPYDLQQEDESLARSTSGASYDQLTPSEQLLLKVT